MASVENASLLSEERSLTDYTTFPFFSTFGLPIQDSMEVLFREKNHKFGEQYLTFDSYSSNFTASRKWEFAQRAEFGFVTWLNEASPAMVSASKPDNDTPEYLALPDALQKASVKEFARYRLRQFRRPPTCERFAVIFRLSC